MTHHEVARLVAGVGFSTRACIERGDFFPIRISVRARGVDACEEEECGEQARAAQ
jgi:hypothetical protein